MQGVGTPPHSPTTPCSWRSELGTRDARLWSARPLKPTCSSGHDQVRRADLSTRHARGACDEKARSHVDEARRKGQFQAIYEAAYPRILGYALRHSATPEDAADLVAETFLTAWRRFDELPPDDQTLLWLYGVVHRQLANQRRGQRRREALADRLAADLAPSLRVWPDQTPSDLAPLGRAWQRLRPQDRELLGLVVWEGLDNGQLARVLGCSRTALKLRLHRARRRFAAELASEGVELASAYGDTTAAGPAMDRSGDRRTPGRPNLSAVAPLVKPMLAAGHEPCGRTPARPGTEELS